jgi:hypothetical protein
LVSDEQAREVAREILARSEFTRWERDADAWLAWLERLVAATPDWLMGALGWLQEAVVAVLSGLARFLTLLGVFGAPGGIVGWLAAAILGAAFIVLVWRWRSERMRTRRTRGGGPIVRRSHADALGEARALARAGHFLEAAHRIQLATLALLIESGWIDLARSDPNRTLRTRILESSLAEPERRQLVQLIDRLEALWFGPRLAGPDASLVHPELFEAWLRLDERIVSQAPIGSDA